MNLDDQKMVAIAVVLTVLSITILSKKEAITNYLVPSWEIIPDKQVYLCFRLNKSINGKITVVADPIGTFNTTVSNGHLCFKVSEKYCAFPNLNVKIIKNGKVLKEIKVPSPIKVSTWIGEKYHLYPVVFIKLKNVGNYPVKIAKVELRVSPKDTYFLNSMT